MSEAQSRQGMRSWCGRSIGIRVVHGHVGTWRHQGRFQSWPTCAIFSRIPGFKAKSTLFHAPIIAKSGPLVCECAGFRIIHWYLGGATMVGLADAHPTRCVRIRIY